MIKANKLVFIGELVYVLWRGVVDVAPYNYYVLMPAQSTEGGARAARATLTFAVYHLNVRVRADIDVISSLYQNNV